MLSEEEDVTNYNEIPVSSVSPPGLSGAGAGARQKARADKHAGN